MHMGRNIKIRSAAASLVGGFATGIATLLYGFSVGAGSGIIVNETYDPPTLNLYGGTKNAANISRQYVPEGVAGSTAMQISGTLLPGPGFSMVWTMMYQNGLVMGNGRATPQNTVLALDVKVDRPDLVNVQLGLQSWGGYAWSYFTPGLPKTASRARIPLGSYTPGKFKTLVLPLDDPLWELNTSGTWDGPFEPTGKTYQILFQVDSTGLPNRGDFTITVDNIKLTTDHIMVPWKGNSAGEVQYTFDEQGNFISATVEEAGFATHVGKFTSRITFLAEERTGDLEITAANGDMLVGYMAMLSDTAFVVAIEGGTGRFEGATGSYLGTLAWLDDFTFTSEAEGTISTVGSNKE